MNKSRLDLYVPDDVVTTAEQDAFGHSHVADAALQSILNTSPPFIIGIFGGWGTGKSSILSLVENALKLKNIPNTAIDAWQYSSAEDLKRAFLVRVAKEVAPKLLDELRGRLYTVERETLPAYRSQADLNSHVDLWKTIRTFSRNSLQVILTTFFFAVLFFGLLSLFFWLRSHVSDEPKHYFNIVEVINSFLQLAFIPFIVALINQIRPIITQEPIVVTHERIDADELLAEYFDKVVSSAVHLRMGVRRRLVIFVDNLDRLSDEKMVQALEALKTYLSNQNCIFVVACDDDVVRSVVGRSKLVPAIDKKDDSLDIQTQRQLGEDYLDKFFQQTFRLPAYMEVDLSDFAEVQFARTQLHSSLVCQGGNVRNLLSTILPSDVSSPRKVKRLLNEFIGAYEIAKRREGKEGCQLRHGTLTNDPEFLGKFSTIRAEFPEFYKMLVHNPRLLSEVTAHIRAHNDDEAKKLIKPIGPASKVDSLMGYLRKTQNVTVRDVDPYIWLSQDSLSLGLSSDQARDLRIALSDGDNRKVMEIIEDAGDETEKALLARFASRYVSQMLRGRAQQNGTIVLARIIDSLVPDVQVEIAQVAANLIPHFPIDEFTADEILKVLKRAVRSDKANLINMLIKRLEKEELRLETFDSILRYADVVEDAGATRSVQEWLHGMLVEEE